MKIKVKIQTKSFNIEQETNVLTDGLRNIGSVVTFTGLVRESEHFSADKNPQIISNLVLEHYSGMTEKLIYEMVEEASKRWDINSVSVVHRIGSLKPTDRIVFVGVASSHRLESFRAAEYIVDYLKVHATLWKKVIVNGIDQWVEPKHLDRSKFNKWSD